MENTCCEVKVTELDEGYRIEVTGEKIKEMLGDCMKRCIPEGRMSWPKKGKEGEGCC